MEGYAYTESVKVKDPRCSSSHGTDVPCAQVTAPLGFGLRQSIKHQRNAR